MQSFVWPMSQKNDTTPLGEYKGRLGPFSVQLQAFTFLAGVDDEMKEGADQNDGGASNTKKKRKRNHPKSGENNGSSSGGSGEIASEKECLLQVWSLTQFSSFVSSYCQNSSRSYY